MRKSLTKRLRNSELILEVLNHDHRDELIDLMFEQVRDQNQLQVVSEVT